MRLLYVDANSQIRLTSNLINNIPRYAILSHTWGDDSKEVSFKDITKDTKKTKAGYQKLRFCAKQAACDSLKYFWVDTCCIDKSNSTELSEAIISMFRWYRNATHCYVYLSDVSTTGQDPTVQFWSPAFRESRWFTRGWTLQELIAPSSVKFFSREGQLLGSKHLLEQQVHEITGIPVKALREHALSDFSVDARFFWADRRETKLEEDKAYSLQGIFEVIMPVLYGEGKERAFKRLREEINKLKRSTHNRDLVTNLLVTKPAMDRKGLITSKGQPIKDASEWILDLDPYKKWENLSTGSQWLWISGGEGTGKTMLSIFLTNELEKSVNGQRLVLYYFCDTDSRRNSGVSLLRGLIYSLICERPQAMRYFQREFEDQDQRLFHSGTHAIESLWGILTNMINDSSTGPIYCVIDGLDELKKNPESQLEHVLKKLRNMRREYTESPSNLDMDAPKSPLEQRPDEQLPVFKLAIFSREEPECILNELSEYTRIRLPEPQEKSNSQDRPDLLGLRDLRRSDGQIDDTGLMRRSESVRKFEEHVRNKYSQALLLYTREKIKNLAEKWRYSQTIEDYLFKSFERRGDGTFLWVDAAVAYLDGREGKLSTLENDLNSVPNGIEGIYCLSLLEIAQDLNALIPPILAWVTVALEPLKLDELTMLLNMTDTQHIVQIESSVVEVIRQNESFLEYNEVFGVRLVHNGIQEFLTASSSCLLANPRLRQFHIDESVAHGKMANACIDYLEKSSLQESCTYFTSADPNLEKDMDKIDSNKTREKAPPFLRYAALHLVDHMRRSKPEAIDFNTPLFEPKSKIRKNWFQSIYKIASGGDSRDAPTTNSRLHIAAYFNLLNFAQHISKESGFSTRLGRGNSHLITPLFVAAAGGNVDVFKFLLDQGAPRILYGENILTFASRLGQIKIVELLLKHTSLVNETVNENITQKGIRAFFRFAPNSLKNKMLNRGEQAHLDFEELCTQDFGGGISALQAAVFGGHKEIVELLVDNKAKLDHVSSEGWSVAHFAVWAGRPDVLELVQLRGVDLKVVTKKQWTALHFAALRGHTAVLPQLVESGLELDASNDQNETPLHLAADHGHAKMVEALIERGANIEAVTSKGVTPLQIAVAENQEAVTEQLLKHGAKEDTSQTLNATKLPWVGGKDDLGQLRRS